ncbi:efflux RND transporter periplasmic adaptor subunit [Piscinibacter koreensis]|uniref:Efflux RND transporter periplasmic adaptor subunit n=1 Tax=Piscinibacter koreensis TaxID=2742824 RepID=A0A7Y6NL09_9BURK|nr:efflux RND transporter periplasmic adaptor subunit [Schlegelella koreensis]NUZ05036.1 efflux RND transporter periplasmic adaptor subunit [Schlegelella koreensis]
MKKSVLAAIAVVALVAIGAGYIVSRQDPTVTANAPGAAGRGASGAASGAGGAAVSVTTVRAQQRDVDVQLEATGTVTALNSVDVRPQVASTITKVHIREGQFVKAGQLLFTLDARADEVNVTRARAQLAKDMAALADAQRQLARSKELFAQNFVSQVAVDTNQTLVESQQAVVAADRAAIEAAQVGLSYTRIAAPSAGRAGAINVFAGSSVAPTGNPLVTITQLDPIAVAFSLPQRHLSDALQTLRSGGGRVEAVVPEGRGTLVGKLQFVDNAVDAASGTVRVKAQFANADERLWPGAFVNVRLAVQTLKGAIVVPQASVITSPTGRIVYVVEASGKAAARPVELVYAAGEDAVVTGVKPGERVVLEGRQNLRPGSNVVERGGAGTRGGRGNGAASGAAGGRGDGGARVGMAAGGAGGPGSRGQAGAPNATSPTTAP